MCYVFIRNHCDWNHEFIPFSLTQWRYGLFIHPTGKSPLPGMWRPLTRFLFYEPAHASLETIKATINLTDISWGTAQPVYKGRHTLQVLGGFVLCHSTNHTSSTLLTLHHQLHRCRWRAQIVRFYSMIRNHFRYNHVLFRGVQQPLC